MRAHGFLATALVLFFALGAQAQIAQDYPAGGDMGYWDWTQPMAVPVALTDTTVVLPVQGIHAYPDRPEAGLQVLRHLHGLVEVDFVPIPGQLLDAEGIWHEPSRLDDESIVMPGPGPDGVYATLDDVLVFVTGLQEPANASVQIVPLGTRGPTRFDKLHVDAPRRVFFFQGYLDGQNVYDEQMVIVINDIGSPAQNVQSMSVAFLDQTGGAPFFVQIDSGWVMPLTGKDAFFGTPDDELGHLTFGPNGTPMMTVNPVGKPLHMPTDGSWPRRAGPDAVVFATRGNELGTYDDEIIRIYDFSTAFTLRPTGTDDSLALQGTWGNTPFTVDDDGTMITTDAGLDEVWGTDDDVVEIHSDQGVERLGAGVALGVQGEANPVEPVALSDTVTLIPHQGTSSFTNMDKGVVAIVEVSPGVHSVTPFLIFSDVKHIVRMDATSAMVFTDTGSSFYFTGLGTSALLQFQVSLNGWDGVSKPHRISPATVSTYVPGSPTASYLVEDTLRLHKVAKTWSYGSESPNASNYTLDIGVGNNQPLLGGSAFEVTLSDAPANEPAILIASLHRDHLQVMPDVYLLVEPESVLHMFNWGTFANGATSISLLPPSNPLFQGLAGHFQWLVWDGASPRGFQLSKGLAVSF